MANNKDYQVSYILDVKAGDGLNQLNAFSTAVGKLVGAQKDISTAASRINSMFSSLNSTFKNGNNKSYNLKFNVKVANNQLDGVIKKLDAIHTKSNNISLNLLAGNVDQRDLQKRMTMYAKARAAADRSVNKKENTAAVSLAKSNSKTASGIISQTRLINNAIGKTVSALHKLKSGVDVNIKTDKAKTRLNELISLMRQLKKEANINVNMAGGAGSARRGAAARQGAPTNYSASPVFRSSSVRQSAGYGYPTGYRGGAQNAVRALSSGQGSVNSQRSAWRSHVARNGQYVAYTPVPSYTWTGRTAPWSSNPYVANPNKQYRPLSSAAPRPTAIGHQRPGAYPAVQKAAMNRLQYSQAPTWRSLPFAGMLNAYFMYSAFKNELGDAIQFSHTMSSAENVLRATDGDMATFQERFSSMTAHVRKIGVDTRFTMVEMAETTKALAKAGFSANQIKQVIRPVSDLALVSDSPIQEIASQISGIMHGYGIDTKSASGVADILTNSSNRTQISIPEIAEAMKMSAGFMKMAGVDFNEGVAAAGVLGNSNLRGTMGGTSLRSMMTFMAKPSRGSKQTLDRLGVSFTEDRDVYGKTVKFVRPLADIMEDLNKAGAGLKEMSAIFGKIGGTGAMVLVNQYDQLRSLTESNKSSNGMAHELGLKQQNTTSGLWEQLTSQWSEAFTQAYENLEPAIRVILRDLGSKLASNEFVDGVTSLGQSMLTVFDIASKIGGWVATHWHWLEPIMFTGVAAKAIFKTAGAISNLVVAMGGAARLSAGLSSLGMVSSFGSMAAGATQTSSAVGGLGRTMASTINTGRGVTGAAAAIGAFGTSAAVATGFVSILAGAAAYAGYQVYQLYQKKEALKEEMGSENSYYYPSIDALNNSLKEAYQNAILAKNAKDALTDNVTVDDAYKNVTGGGWSDAVFGFNNSIVDGTVNGVKRAASNIWRTLHSQWVINTQGDYVKAGKIREEQQAKNDKQLTYNYNDQLRYKNIGEKAADDNNAVIAASSFNYLVAHSGTPTETKYAMRYIRNQFKDNALKSDPSLYYIDPKTGDTIVKDGFEKRGALAARQIPAAENRSNALLKEIESGNGYMAVHSAYVRAVSNRDDASNAVFNSLTGLTPEYLQGKGYKNTKGKWVAPHVDKNATEEDRVKTKTAIDEVSNLLSGTVFEGLKKTYKTNAAVAKILETAGFSQNDYGTNPASDNNIFNTNGMSGLDDFGGGKGGDDKGAGGKYGGAGKIGSAAPKQVNVTITNLMSIETVKLMGTTEGQNPQVQDLKDSLTQALMDVVHDFDASWNA